MPSIDDQLGATPEDLQDCRRCDLWKHASQAVVGEGAAKARIMLVGEQPGDEEDLQGHPFVGPAGEGDFTRGACRSERSSNMRRHE